MAQTVKNPPAMWQTWVRSLGWEDLLEMGMATHSSILAWRIPWTEEPGQLQSIGSQRVGHDWATKHIYNIIKYNIIYNRDLLYSTGNYIQYFTTVNYEKEYEKEYICVKRNHFAVHLKLTQHCESTILQLKTNKKEANLRLFEYLHLSSIQADSKKWTPDPLVDADGIW